MYPVSGRYETRIAGTTTVKKAWADATDDALNGLYGGTKTIVALSIDGTGNQVSGAAPGSVIATGSVQAGTDLDANGKLQIFSGRSSSVLGSGQAMQIGAAYKDTLLFAGGRVSINGGTAITVLRSFNIASVTRIGVGRYDVVLQTPAPNLLVPVVNAVDNGAVQVLIDSGLGGGQAPTLSKFRVLYYASGVLSDPSGVGEGGFSFMCLGF